MFGGYSHTSEDNALSNSESVGLNSLQRHNLVSSFVSASAVTLSMGVLLTGGKTSGKQVFLLTDFNQEVKKDMFHSRYGHAIERVDLNNQEVVIVAGGFLPPEVGQPVEVVQATVELYNVEQNFWSKLTNLNMPRVYFSIQVKP